MKIIKILRIVLFSIVILLITNILVHSQFNYFIIPQEQMVAIIYKDLSEGIIEYDVYGTGERKSFQKYQPNFKELVIYSVLNTKGENINFATANKIAEINHRRFNDLHGYSYSSIPTYIKLLSFVFVIFCWKKFFKELNTKKID